MFLLRLDSKTAWTYNFIKKIEHSVMKSQKKLHFKTCRTPNKKTLKKTVRKETSGQFDSVLYQKFMKFMNNQRLNSLKSKLSEFYGKNFTINYKKHYSFNQQWQSKKSKEDQKSEYQTINQAHFPGIFFSFIIMMSYTITIWFRNVELFFREDDQSRVGTIVYVICALCQLIDFLDKIWSKLRRDQFEFTLSFVLSTIYQNIVCLLFLVLNLVRLDNISSPFWMIFEGFSLLFLYIRASQIYQSFRLMNFALIYQYQIKAFDLIVNLILIAHVIAIILWETTKLGYENTWFSALGLTFTNQFIRYIYSFYFCATTILTVGYGDISPKNYIEVLVVTIVEVFGIIIFAYLINQIGYSLSTLRKGRESIEKQLTLIQKMRKYYKTDDDLILRARSYLINHKPKVDQLAPQEQKAIMVKFNEELRNEIAAYNSLAVVKTCIFFLCRWSKAMQTAVSCRLVGILFSPGEQIYQPQGKERIYIMKLGKIDIYTERRGNRRGNKSTLKTITSSLDRQVSDNCYGYTAVISTRPVRLYAISKDFTSGYFIDKEKFKECINERASDFEYYHEIKDRIDQSPCWQALEVPSLQNSKKHYNPTRLHIIRRHKRQIGLKQTRRCYIRIPREAFRGPTNIYDMEYVKNLQRTLIPSLQDFNMYESEMRELRRTLTKKSIVQIKDSIKVTNSSQNIGDFVNQYEIRTFFGHYFQQSKEYSNFFPRNNLTEVMRRYQSEYFFQAKIKSSDSIPIKDSQWKVFLTSALQKLEQQDDE